MLPKPDNLVFIFTQTRLFCTKSIHQLVRFVCDDELMNQFTCLFNFFVCFTFFSLVFRGSDNT